MRVKGRKGLLAMRLQRRKEEEGRRRGTEASKKLGVFEGRLVGLQHKSPSIFSRVLITSRLSRTSSVLFLRSLVDRAPGTEASKSLVGDPMGT